MKTLSLVVNMDGIKLSDDEKSMKPVELVVTLIKNVILSSFNQGQQRGMPENDRHRYYKLCDVLDKAVKEDAQTIELEDDYFGMIREAKKKCPLMPNDFLRRVEENIDAVPMR